MTAEERFWEKVDRRGPDECWAWLGGISFDGYGKLGSRRAHRISWELHNSPIPDGLFVCHICDNRRCVNPAHLWLGTNQDNLADASAKGRNIRQREPRLGLTGVRPPWSVIAEIRMRHAAGESGSSLARAYALSPATISRYVTGSRRNGRKWGPPYRT